MNFLVLYPEEVAPDGTFVLRGPRRDHFSDAHALPEGVTVGSSVKGGGRGEATILHVSQAEVRGVFREISPAFPRLNVEVIIAVPRPQTIKKVLAGAAASGVSHLHFLKTEGVVPSYLSSKMLEDTAIAREFLLSMEQTGDSLAPQVSIHRNFDWFMAHHLPAVCQRCPSRLFADTRAETSEFSLTGPCAIAIGPESGWTERERDVFLNAGFFSVSLGPRILRVEHAMMLLLGAISYGR